MLFPGPTGLLGLQPFTDYWNQYYFFVPGGTPPLNPPRHAPTFGDYYGSLGQYIDANIAGNTMLWNSNNGIFDRVALHCYETDLGNYVSTDPGVNRALQYLAWMRDYIDPSGYVYVTETGGYPVCADPGPPPPDAFCTCGDNYGAGSSLASYEVIANNQFAFTASGSFLQAIYGYILMDSNCGATTNGWHAISDNFIQGYNDGRTFP